MRLDRYLSDEWFDDHFVAELGVFDWYFDEESAVLAAPNNFATDESANVMGSTSPHLDGSAGTTGFARSSNTLTAATAVTPGVHDLYLSMFDATDADYGSMVLLDGLDVGAVDPEFCTSGASFAPISPIPELATFMLAAGGLAVAAVVVGRKLR